MDKLFMLLSILFFVIKLTCSTMQAGKTLDAWDVNFDGKLFSKENCEAVLVSPHEFLAEAECVRRGLNISDSHITVNYRHVRGVYINVTTINKSNVHFSEGIEEKLNMITKKVALLIADQPVVYADCLELSTTALVLTYDDPCRYTAENLITEMALSSDGLINYSRCFVPVFNGTDIDVSPCRVRDDDVVCTYNQEVSDRNLRLKNFVYCEKKYLKGKKFVVGMLLEKTFEDLKKLDDEEIPKEISVESLITSGYIYF